MKTLWTRLFWGLLLVAAGGLFMAQNLGFISVTAQATPTWGYGFAIVAVLFLITYFVNGITHWGWLFPTFIFGSIAGLIFMSGAAFPGSLGASAILASVGLPFLVAFVTSPRKRWWALIPAWVMLVLTAFIAMSDFIPEEMVGGGILFSIGVPFLVVYLLKTTRWWALIPAFVTMLMGAVIALSPSMGEDATASLILLAIAVPFLVLVLTSIQRWWALLPAGTLVSAAAIPMLSSVGITNDGTIIGAFFGGLTLTFFVLWLLRSKAPTRWAIVPAVCTAIFSAASFLFSGQAKIVGPAVLIVAGLMVLALAFRKQNPA
jgi:hypothetical protein